MNNLLVVLLVFSVVGVVGLSLNKLLNRGPMREISAARRRLIDQAKSLQDGDVDHFFDECGLSSVDRAAARSILEFFAKLLSVSPEKMARNHDMRKLFAVSHAEPGSELHPFATELVEGLASLSDKQRWEQKWTETPDLPRNEDALIRFIMGMSVTQVLQFFAPLMKRA